MALVVVGATMWQWAGAYRAQGELQDDRLLHALALLDAEGLAVVQPFPSQIMYSVTSMSGERLAGVGNLPAFPWTGSLKPTTAPSFYWLEAKGVLMRAAVVLRGPAGETEAAVLQVAEPLSNRWPRWRDRWSDFLMPLYAGCAFLAALSWLVTRRIATVLRRAEVEGLASDEPDLPPSVPDELAPLIHRTRTLVREQQAWVDQQRRFLADASHQLRTPMAVLRAQLQAALAGDVQAHDVLEQMLHTVDRAAGLANQLLSLTRLEQVKRQGGLPSIDAREVARTAVLELAPLIAAKRIDLSLDESSFVVPADATMLGELIRNLLANAIHHAPERARVGIVLRQGAGRRELIVWDEGPGIDNEVRPRLFHPFSAGKGGVGLGLSICRQIAEAMGAQVELHNRCDGGTVIGVDAVVAWGQPP